ncbi:MAG TPA: hypothetical protein VFN78_04040 [Ktedonobacterales bacterium]|nr:hypothetical protein [Ktedonobacterales bacterium]
MYEPIGERDGRGLEGSASGAESRGIERPAHGFGHEWSASVRVGVSRLAPGADGWWALGLIVVGALVRLGLALLQWPRTDSDEGTMGLMALHVGAGRELPLFFDGQSYMGTIQAYLGALLFHLFGASLVSLRLGLVLLFVLFLLIMYPLLRLLYGLRYALVGLLLLDLGGPDLLQPQLLALGGYPETLLFGALSLLLALRLALRAQERPNARRLALYGALGLTMGVGWWSDQLIFPFLVVSALTLALFCRRELRWRGALALLAGMVVGLAPQFIYLITQPTANSPSAVAALGQGGHAHASLIAQVGAHLFGTLLVALPNITGVGWLCPAPTLPNGALAAPSTAGALACLGMRAGWSAGLLALGVVAALAAWRSLRAIAPRLTMLADLSQPARTDALRQVGRLMLLLGGALTLAFYLVSAASATPAGNARYLIELDIALPALAYPLWPTHAWPHLRLLGARATTPSGVWLRRVALGLLALTLLGGVVASYRASAATRASYQADLRLISDLERLGVRHMRTDYWTCGKVAFLSGERITCDVLRADLTPGDNRYPPYVAQVEADPRAAYVFPESLPQAQTLAQKARDPAWPYTLTRIDGYAVWLPR